MAREKFDYFKAFNLLTEKAIAESEILVEIFENFSGTKSLSKDMERSHQIEHEGDEINHEVFKNVAIDFITPIDREDLLDLSCNLDNILDQIEGCIQDIYMYDIHKLIPEAIEFSKLIKKSCVALNKCTSELKNYKKNRMKIAEYVVKVNDIEEEADYLYVSVNRRLYTEENDKPMKVLVWSRIMNDLENCCDACEHASDVIRSVILKNS